MSNNNQNRITRKDLEGKSLEFLIEYILKLDEEWFKFSNERIVLENKIKELEKLKPTIYKEVILKSFYNKKDKWIDKLTFIIKENNKPMNMKEIKDKIFYLEPEVKFRWSNPHNQIYQLLNKACFKNILSKRKGKDKLYIFDLISI